MYLVEKDKIVKENLTYIYWEEKGKLLRAKKKIRKSGRHFGGFARRRKIQVHAHTVKEITEAKN